MSCSSHLMKNDISGLHGGKAYQTSGVLLCCCKTDYFSSMVYFRAGSLSRGDQTLFVSVPVTRGIFVVELSNFVTKCYYLCT